MRSSRLLAAGAFVSLFVFGCNDDHNSVSGPPISPAATPTPSSSNPNAWTVTVTFESITGDPCAIVGLGQSYVPVPGAPWDVIREGTSIVFRYLPDNYPTDNTDYTGTWSGRSFTASRGGTTGPLQWSCADGQIVQNPRQTEQVSGTFAADDRTFDAEEIETWRLPSGAEATMRRHWTGTRL